VSRERATFGKEELLCQKLAVGMMRDEAVRRAQRGKPVRPEALWSDVQDGRSLLVDCFRRGGYRYFVVLPESDAAVTLGALADRTEEVLGVLAPMVPAPAASRRS